MNEQHQHSIDPVLMVGAAYDQLNYALANPTTVQKSFSGRQLGRLLVAIDQIRQTLEEVRA